MLKSSMNTRCKIAILLVAMSALPTAGGVASAQAVDDPSDVSVRLTANDWTEVGRQELTFGRCLPSDFMTGRRVGDGQNPQEWLRCSWLEDARTQARVFPGKRNASGWVEDLTHTFTCPYHRAMYQRIHVNDSLGDTQYRCAELLLHNASADGGRRRLLLGDAAWGAWISWRSRTFECPDGSLITGLQRDGARIRYRCAAIGGSEAA